MAMQWLQTPEGAWTHGLAHDGPKLIEAPGLSVTSVALRMRACPVSITKALKAESLGLLEILGHQAAGSP